MDIRIGVVGTILSGGDENERYIKIADNTESTGGFLILTAEDPDMKRGFDAWVKDRDELEKYFNEANYTVDWTSCVKLVAGGESGSSD